MELKVFVRGVDEPSHLRDFAEEKLSQALERFHEHVLDATLRLVDETGPEKHGVDKQCSIDVRLRTGDVHIHEKGAEFMATVDVAVDRLRAALSREAGKAKRGVGEG